MGRAQGGEDVGVGGVGRAGGVAELRSLGKTPTLPFPTSVRQLYIHQLTTQSPHSMLSATIFATLLTALLSFWLFAFEPTRHFWIGFALIIAATYLYVHDDAKRGLGSLSRG